MKVLRKTWFRVLISLLIGQLIFICFKVFSELYFPDIYSIAIALLFYLLFTYLVKKSIPIEHNITKLEDELVYPIILMGDIFWSFDLEKHSDINTFKKSLIAYNKEIEPGVEPEVDHIILTNKEIIVLYSFWKEEDSVDENQTAEIRLKSENKEGFTIAEILFQLHSKISSKLRNDEEHFFEGIQYVTDRNGIPIYQLLQGT
ncbi:MAG: hypothetical protein R2852_01665 [Bacteroidia bacterium]